LVAEEPSVAIDCLTFDDLLSQLLELVQVVGDHDVADGVVALDVPHSLTVDQEVLTNHLHIAEPVSPVISHVIVL